MEWQSLMPVPNTYGGGYQWRLLYDWVHADSSSRKEEALNTWKGIWRRNMVTYGDPQDSLNPTADYYDSKRWPGESACSDAIAWELTLQAPHLTSLLALSKWKKLNMTCTKQHLVLLCVSLNLTKCDWSCRIHRPEIHEIPSLSHLYFLFPLLPKARDHRQGLGHKLTST